MDRCLSLIHVHILDVVPMCSAILNQARERFTQCVKDAERLEPFYKVGYIQTKRGLFVLDSEGHSLAPSKEILPIEQDNPAIIELHYIKGRAVGLSPCLIAKLTPQRLMKQPTHGTIPLHEFIATRSERLENSYHEWRRITENIEFQVAS